MVKFYPIICRPGVPDFLDRLHGRVPRDYVMPPPIQLNAENAYLQYVQIPYVPFTYAESLPPLPTAEEWRAMCAAKNVQKSVEVAPVVVKLTEEVVTQVPKTVVPPLRAIESAVEFMHSSLRNLDRRLAFDNVPESLPLPSVEIEVVSADPPVVSTESDDPSPSVDGSVLMYLWDGDDTTAVMSQVESEVTSSVREPMSDLGRTSRPLPGVALPLHVPSIATDGDYTVTDFLSDCVPAWEAGWQNETVNRFVQNMEDSVQLGIRKLVDGTTALVNTTQLVVAEEYIKLKTL